MAKNIFEAFAGRGVYLDARDDAVEVDVDAINRLLQELVSEPDEDARQELADELQAVIEGKPAKKPAPTIGQPVEASFATSVPASSFVNHCRHVAGQR
jgi:hypothetical protein